MTRNGVWRYARWLPAVEEGARVSLGEGDTPLVPLPRWGAAHGLRRAYAKLEFANPSGSFKDRGMAVLVSVSHAGGARHLTEDSSGNAGASAAAYAARAGMTCTVYAPAAAPEAKLRQIRAYGAELVPVPGPRSAVANAARAAGSQPGAYHVSHNENPVFIEGNKTFAFELLEALPEVEQAGDAGRPWHVVVPTGGGALYYGAWLGFQAWAEAGKVPPAGSPAAAQPPGAAAQPQDGLPVAGQRLPWVAPRLHVAQTTACPPIVAAWEAGLAEPAPITRHPTVCGGIEIERPARGAQILHALRASGGAAVASDDAAILEERDRLAHLEGIYAEPTSAAAFAGLAELARRGLVAPEDLVIVPVTGSGLKDPGPQV